MAGKNVSRYDLRTTHQKIKKWPEAIPDYIFVRSNGLYVRVNFSDIIFIKAMKVYSIFVTKAKTHIVYNKLRDIDEVLPKTLFCRIHHSYIVAISQVKAFNNNILYLADQPEETKRGNGLASMKELPIGNVYKKNIRESIWYLPSSNTVFNKEGRRAVMAIENGEEELV